MRLGPVFFLELVTTARRARYYVTRTVLGLILLAVLGQNARASWFWRMGRAATAREMADLARSLFDIFSITQLIAVVVLTPVLLAGVIADEKQRKTLSYLLASRLTSGEIILDKLAARLLHVGVLLAVGLPILSLLTLLGGISPTAVARIYIGMASTAFFLGGVSILISTHARKVREAMVGAILFVVLWLFGPWMMARIVAESWPAVATSVREILRIFSIANPFLTLGAQLDLAGSGWGDLLPLVEMIAAHLAIGALCLGIAAWRLRPVFRAQAGEGRANRARFQPAWRGWLWSRPDCGADPMLWKERYTTRRGSALVRWLLRASAAFGLLVLSYWTLRLGFDAWRELWKQGFVPEGQFFGRRWEFNVLIRVASVLIFVIWGIGLAVTAASSISSEREEDTWNSLLTTDLTPAEIIRAKMFGSFWSLRALPATMIALWLIGVLLGALFPLGAVFGLIECAVFAWFIIALGIQISLTARATTRAVAATVSLVILLGGGYLIFCFPLLALRSTTILVGCSPFILGISLISYQDFAGFFHSLASHTTDSDSPISVVVTCFLGSLIYAAAAVLLTTSVIHRFDDYVGRPRRKTRP